MYLCVCNYFALQHLVFTTKYSYAHAFFFYCQRTHFIAVNKMFRNSKQAKSQVKLQTTKTYNKCPQQMDNRNNNRRKAESVEDATRHMHRTRSEQRSREADLSYTARYGPQFVICSRLMKSFQCLFEIFLQLVPFILRGSTLSSATVEFLPVAVAFMGAVAINLS